MERQSSDENSPKALHAFGVHWIKQRLGEWEHSFKNEESYTSWLLSLIKENGYTLKELKMLRQGMVFERTIGTILILVTGARQKLRGFLRQFGMSDMDSSPSIDELVQNEIHRHECLIVEILSGAIARNRPASPRK